MVCSYQPLVRLSQKSTRPQPQIRISTFSNWLKVAKISIVDNAVQVHKTTMVNSVKTRSGAQTQYFESTSVALAPLTDEITVNELYETLRAGREGHYAELPDKSGIARGYTQIYYSVTTLDNVSYYSMSQILGGLIGPGSGSYLESGIKYYGAYIQFGQTGNTAHNGYRSFSGEEYFGAEPRDWTCTYDKFDTWIPVSSSYMATLNCQARFSFGGRNSAWDLNVMNSAFSS